MSDLDDYGTIYRDAADYGIDYVRGPRDVDWYRFIVTGIVSGDSIVSATWSADYLTIMDSLIVGNSLYVRVKDALLGRIATLRGKLVLASGDQKETAIRIEVREK